MAISNIPLLSGSYAYSQQVSLDGKIYEMDLRYNARESRWYLSISRENTMLKSNIKVVTGADLLDTWKYMEGMPQGQLAIVDLSGNNNDPDATTFGDTVIMQYTDAI